MFSSWVDRGWICLFSFTLKIEKNLKTRVCFLRVRKMPLWNGIETNVSGDNNARNKPEVRGIWNEIIFAPIPFECDGALSVTESSILSLQSWRYFTGNSNYIVYSQVIESKNDPRFTVFYRTAALITMKLMQNSTDYVKTEQLLYMHLSIYWEPRKRPSPLSCSLRVQSVSPVRVSSLQTQTKQKLTQTINPPGNQKTQFTTFKRQ